MQENVSLLPPEIKKKRIDEKKQGKVIRIALIVFVVLLAVYAFLLVSFLFARGELQALQEERDTVETQAAELAKYEELYNRMDEAEGLINTAMGRVPLWGEFLGNLGRAMNPDAALIEISVSYEDNEETGSFNMRGWTYTHRNVGDMLDRVHELEQLDAVRCQVSAATTIDQTDAVEFNVNAEVEPGPQFFEPEEGGN